MANRRWKDYEWPIATADGKHYESISQAQLLAVMMDIRDQLQSLNAVFHCGHFLDVPRKLDRIEKNTRKRQQPKVAKPKLTVVRS